MRTENRDQRSEASGRWVGALVVMCAAVTLAVAIGGLSGCAGLDRAAYNRQVTWTNAPVVHVFTNTVVLTNTVPVVTEWTNVVYVTNAATGAVSGYMTREPAATNLVAAVLTNFVPVFYTNVVQVPVTNLVAKPEAVATIEATGAVVNTFAPGIGSILALALGGLYHGYRQLRNRRVTEALVQGVETARAVLTTTPQGQAADAQFVKWLSAPAPRWSRRNTTANSCPSKRGSPPHPPHPPKPTHPTRESPSRPAPGPQSASWELIPSPCFCVGSDRKIVLPLPRDSIR